MKSRTQIFLLVIMLQSCATPRYSYYFDHQRPSTQKQISIVEEVKPLRVDPDLVTASSQESAAPAPVLHQMVTVKAAQEEIKMRPNPAVRSSIPGRNETEFMSPPKGGKSKDLRLAAIFGAAGLVALIIGGSPLNVLGGIAILVGLFLFVRWIIRR